MEQKVKSPTRSTFMIYTRMQSSAALLPPEEAMSSLTNTASFQSKYGILTKAIRTKFLDRQVKLGRMSPDDCLENNDKVMSLQASLNIQDPLYFWQIYSITGETIIYDLVKCFYTQVYNNTSAENAFFLETFEDLGSFKSHVRKQASMYLDCFGGGCRYGGGEERLDIHHRYMAFELMNAHGAKLWTMHMKMALQEMKDALDAVDLRLVGAIQVFLQFFMDMYGETFDFDPADFAFSETY